jgi:hypothetical protein
MTAVTAWSRSAWPAPWRLADRAAHLVDGDAGDLGLALAQDGRGGRKNRGPLGRGHAGPRTVVERRPRRAHRAVDVGRRGHRDLADDLFGGGRNDAEPVAACGLGPGSPDEELPPVHQPVVHADNVA